MSTAPATVEDADAGELAAAVREAPFVGVVAAADGDSLAASGVLARALGERSTPFQVRVDPVPDPLPGDGDDLVVGLGVGGGDLSLAGDDRPVSVGAAAAARELGVDPDPVLALAGVAAAGRPVGDAASLLESAERRTAVERRPGVAIPTPDPADGLAHSTLVSASPSGDPEAAEATLADLGVSAEPSDEERRRLASWLAVEASASSARAAEAVERALHPYATPDGRFATVGGFGDALDAAARERPGSGVALAIRDGDAARVATLDAWRAHGRAVHGALADATTGRYDGVFVARVEEGNPGRLGTVARLCRDFRSPEPVALAVGDDAAAAASTADAALDRAMAEAVRAVDADGRSVGGSRRATARFGGAVEVSRLITAFREALE
ncbi:exonuclease RecJ [Haloplanus halophilus]|uniref:exonuclease RecJ n=1 Tax=Haloplanus halophilus TaxID=2949993 RepID=UPI00203FC71C|nr:exonuclease RecJ [Haloplanus sp. GDY1]